MDLPWISDPPGFCLVQVPFAADSRSVQGGLACHLPYVDAHLADVAGEGRWHYIHRTDLQYAHSFPLEGGDRDGMGMRCWEWGCLETSPKKWMKDGDEKGLENGSKSQENRMMTGLKWFSMDFDYVRSQEVNLAGSAWCHRPGSRHLGPPDEGSATAALLWGCEGVDSKAATERGIFEQSLRRRFWLKKNLFGNRPENVFLDVSMI